MLGDNDFIPKTYHVKGFKQRKKVNLKKLVMYFCIILVSLLTIGIVALSAAELI